MNAGKLPSPFIVFRSALFFLVQSTITVVMTPVVLAASLLPRYEYRYRLARLWAWLLIQSLRLICGIRHQIEGLENIPQGNGIVASKHQSAWETLMLYLIFPKAVYVLKRELLTIPFFGWCLGRYHHIAIDRSQPRAALVSLVKQGLQRLREGHWIIIFPEGTRVAPGERKRYAGSAGTLARKAGVPVVPVAHNAGEHWPRNGFIKIPGTIRMRIGPPLEGGELEAAEINRRLEEWIEARMREIGRP